MVRASYSNADVSGSGGVVGGLVGVNGGTVTAGYATGRVSGSGGAIGGLAGSNSGAITAGYATARVVGTGGAIGGLVGGNGGAVTGSYWDTDTSGQAAGDGAGRTTAALQAPVDYGGIGRIPDFPVTRSHPPASWPSAAKQFHLPDL